MLIRPFQLSDAIPVMKLWQGAVSLPEASIAPLVRQLSSDSDWVLVAEDEERIIGLVVAEKKDKVALIHRILVSPEYRNRGVGRQLIKKMEERVSTKGVTQLFFAPDEYTVKDLSFFEWLGLSVYPKMNMRLN